MASRPKRQRVDPQPDPGDISSSDDDNPFDDDDGAIYQPASPGISDEESEFFDDSEDEEPRPPRRVPSSSRGSGPVPLTLTSTDGTKWTTTPPTSSRTTAANIVTAQLGLLGSAQQKMTAGDTFGLFFGPAILDVIVRHTNAYAIHMTAQKKILKPDYPDWTPLNIVELRAFIGLLLLAGVEKCRLQPVEELWSGDPKFAHPAFTATMSRNRFKAIQRFLRFDDKVDRDRRKALGEVMSKLGPVLDILNPFSALLPTFLEPGTNLTVDEMLLRFRGQAPFRVYMANKPGKYGIKVWAIVCSETGYILQIRVYTGKIDGVVQTGLGKSVVLDLASPYLGTGRGITADNFFSSKALAEELLAQNTTYVGTMKHQRREVPKQLVQAKGKQPLSSEFVFCGPLTMVAYIPRKNKTVLLISSQHHSKEISTLDHKKPEVILHYNYTKSGVDTADQMVGTFSSQRSTRRWPSKLFYCLLDIAALNSYVIFKKHLLAPGDRFARLRRQFIRSLSLELIIPHMEIRIREVVNLHGSIRTAMRLFLPPTTTLTPAPAVAPAATQVLGRAAVRGPGGQIGRGGGRVGRPGARRGRDATGEASRHRCQIGREGVNARDRSRTRNPPCAGCGRRFCVVHSTPCCSECTVVRPAAFAPPLDVLAAQPIILRAAQPAVVPAAQPAVVPAAQPAVVPAAQPVNVMDADLTDSDEDNGDNDQGDPNYEFDEDELLDLDN